MGRPASKAFLTALEKSRKPPWSGMCPAGKHGLDFEGQDCDVCRHDRGGPCGAICRRCSADKRKAVRHG